VLSVEFRLIWDKREAIIAVRCSQRVERRSTPGVSAQGIREGDKTDQVPHIGPGKRRGNGKGGGGNWDCREGQSRV